MPQSLAIGAFVLGAVLLLIALLGGGFKIFGAEVSTGGTGKVGRVLAFVIGLALLGVGFSYQDPKPQTPEPVKPAPFQPVPQPVPQPMPTPIPTPMPAPVAVGFPSGYGMQVCGCWGVNPAPIAPEARCQSGRVRLNACPGGCPTGGVPYAYVCQ